MTLSTGTKLSHYEITSQIGKGGMGEVYQATDTKLGRDVAIKVLPEEFAQDTDRVARFQREAKLLASLNHPNIAAIHGLEEVDGTHFLVMELVEGQTLDEQIKSGAIPVEEALKLALQIAEALESAHEKGVIHRDLKPANIKITPEGKVKVLDFGLAKAFAGEQADLNLSNSPTLSVAATQQGVILGTAAYMSPEQARGKEVDKRADIWAFGVVLFEMLTGKQVFTGDTVSDTLASVLAREPEWQNLPSNLHPRIRLTLERCLEKDSKNRYHDIADVRVDIQKVLVDPSSILTQPVLSEESRIKFRTMIPWLAAILFLGVIIAVIAVWYLNPSEALKPVHFSHYLKEGQYFIDSYGHLAVSPDGNQFVYDNNEGLYLRSINQFEAELISEAGDYELCPFFSPNGKWVGYISSVDRQLKKIPASGGAPEKICDVENVMEASWYAENTIIFFELGQGLMKVSADSGERETLIVEEDEYFYHPRILPGGKSFIYTGVTDEGLHVFVQSFEAEKPIKLFPGDNAFYVPTGHLVYALDTSIKAVPFDVEKLEFTGDPVELIKGVWRRSGAPQFAVSDSGTLVYLPEPPALDQILVWVDMKGNEEPAYLEPKTYYSINLSPDGNQIASSIIEGEDLGVWILDLPRNDLSPFTGTKTGDYDPYWAPDEQKIYYSSYRSGNYEIFSKEVNSPVEGNLFYKMSNRGIFVDDISADGKSMVYSAGNFSNNDIYLLSMEEKSESPLLNNKYAEVCGKISPNMDLLAYKSNETGKFEIYVCTFPDVAGPRKKVSVNGGYDPIWSSDGRTLYYRSEDSIMAVSIETEPVLNAEIPDPLFKDNYALIDQSYTWDIHPDGKRFLMAKDYRSDSGKEIVALLKINIIHNWFEELKERVPVD